MLRSMVVKLPTTPQAQHQKREVINEVKRNLKRRHFQIAEMKQNGDIFKLC